jgi:hypothetical protein
MNDSPFAEVPVIVEGRIQEFRSWKAEVRIRKQKSGRERVNVPVRQVGRSRATPLHRPPATDY